MRSGLPAFTHGTGEEFDTMVAMQDGTRLFTTIQLPDGGGPFPAILVRSPYAQVSLILRDTLCGRFVRYGYACVFQDTRGQGGSEGGWNPGGNNEIEDGRDTLHWLAEQSFQDGNIAMVGSSYLASVQFAALAGGAPDELKTIVPAMYTTDNRGVMYQDGMFRHETYTAWASMMRGSGLSLASAGDEYQQAIRYRPHIDVDQAVFGLPMPWYRQMISAESPRSDYWHRPDTVAVRQVLETTHVPMLMIGGWYDVFFGPQFEDWQRLASQPDSRYIIGPYTHSGTTGDLPTPNSEGGRFQWKQMLPWLEHHLKGKPLTLPTGLNIYEMGDGEWQERERWPAATTQKTFHLANLPDANACDGGVLAELPGQGEVRFRYDPDDPVPTRGGAGMLAFNLPGYGGAPPANVEQLPSPTRLKPVQHHAAMPFEAVAEFMQELDAIESISARALQWLILTATRSRETMLATWDEIDRDNAVWTIPSERMKARREHRVPLSPAAVRLLDRLTPVAGNPHVFVGTRTGNPLSSMALLKCMRDRGYGVKGHRGPYVPHGFRSSFRDWCGEVSSYPRDVAEMALAHVIEDRTEAAYRRGDLFEKRRAMMDDWAAFVTVT